MTTYPPTTARTPQSARRGALAALLALACLMAATPHAHGQAQESRYPERAVTLLLPFPPGGVGDTVARRLAERLSGLWKVPVIVDNKPGAGGNLGANMVAKAPADGYTLLITVYDGLVITKAFGTKVGFDPVQDLVPVALPTLSSTVIVVHPKVPVTDFKGFIAYAKANPGKLNFGSNGNGSSYHLALEQLNAGAGTEMTHVPYKGSGPLFLDLIAGRLDATIATVFLAGPYVADGRLRAVAVGSAERSPVLPQVPTTAEAGLAGFEASVGMGMFAPAATSKALITKINNDVRKVMNEPDIKARFLAEGTSVTNLTAAEFEDRFKRELTSLQGLITRKNLKIEF